MSLLLTLVVALQTIKRAFEYEYLNVVNCSDINLKLLQLLKKYFFLLYCLLYFKHRQIVFSLFPNCL